MGHERAVAIAVMSWESAPQAAIATRSVLMDDTSDVLVRRGEGEFFNKPIVEVGTIGKFDVVNLVDK